VAGVRRRAGARAERQEAARRNSQLVGLGGFVAAAALPWVLWHRSISAIAGDFRLEAEYLLTGWTGYGLMALGLLFLVPVVVSIGRSPASRLYPRSRNAYAAWGVCLYVLGVALASQVAAVTSLHPAP
jgi:hypothetical protein